MNVKAVRPFDTMKIIDRLVKENNGVVRTMDAVRAGLSRTTLVSLVKKGVLERIAHGQYIRSDDMPDELYLLQQRSAKIIF
ncbi:MAG: type IV toxin-antitoxin system AbiEi family antitoxin domain-containing protein, partial [Clostridiales Family XIII bacterium]|nr:type IV toxin-antitoxin system AbiEi family antitoxin domain-containing protein [Clostridiales Family XIII bacterium]